MKTVYLDHAATTYVDAEVFEKMKPYFCEYFGNPSTPYAMGRQAHAALDGAREQVAQGIQAAHAREVYFTACGTESNNWAIKGIAAANRAKGRHIITSKAEHHAVLDVCEYLGKNGYDVTYLDLNENGTVNVKAVEDAIREDTVLITIMFANNEMGAINPIEEIGLIAHERGIVFHTDAVQAVGHIPVDVQKMNIDLLSMSGHKFYAPKGVGALYIRDGIKIDKFMHGGAQERKRRAGTENLASIVGMGAAIEKAVADMDAEKERLTGLREYMIKRILNEIDFCKLNGSRADRLPNNVNISFKGMDSKALLIDLDQAGIACSGGSACTSGSILPSHVLLAMGLEPEAAKSALRFTLGRVTTMEEIDYTVDELKKITGRLKKLSTLFARKEVNPTFV